MEMTNYSAAFLFLLVPILILGYIYYNYKKNQELNKVGDRNLVGKIQSSENLFLKHFKFALAIVGIVFIIIAIMGPKWGKRNLDFMQEGVEVVIAIDVSKSMLAEDVKPSRLEIAHYEIKQLVDKMKGNRVGLIRFAAEAEVLCPLTNDMSALKSYLDVATDQAINAGTNIAEAIRLSKKLYTPTKATNRALIIYSDGENHQGEAISEAKSAFDNGIFIFTFGIGTAKGEAIIERNEQGQKIGHKTDSSGQIVYTKLNENLLKGVAEAGKGAYLTWSSSKSSTKKLFNMIDEIEKSEFTAQQLQGLEDQFVWFALVSFAIYLFIFTIARNW